MNGNKFRLCANENKITALCANEKKNTEFINHDVAQNIQPIFTQIIDGVEKMTLKSQFANFYEDFNTFLSNFTQKIISLGLKHADTDAIFNLSEKLVNETHILCDGLLKQKLGSESETASKILESTTEFICENLKKFGTKYQRNLEQKKNLITLKRRKNQLD